MNDKDREELLILKTDMSYVKEKVSSVEGKLDKFIDAADSKYATKTELANVAKVVSDNKIDSDKGDNKLWDTTKTIVPWILMLIVVILQIVTK